MGGADFEGWCEGDPLGGLLTDLDGVGLVVIDGGALGDLEAGALGVFEGVELGDLGGTYAGSTAAP